MPREPKAVICKLCGARVRTTQALNGHTRFRHGRKPEVQRGTFSMDIIKVALLAKANRNEKGWVDKALKAFLVEWLGS